MATLSNCAALVYSSGMTHVCSIYWFLACSDCFPKVLKLEGQLVWFALVFSLSVFENADLLLPGSYVAFHKHNNNIITLPK